MTWTVIRFSQMLGSPNKPNRSNSSYFIRNTFYQNMTQNNDFLNFKGFTERKQNQTLTEWSYGLRTLSKTFWYCWIRSPLWVICVYHANKNEGHPVHPRVVGSWMIWRQVRLGFSHRQVCFASSVVTDCSLPSTRRASWLLLLSSYYYCLRQAVWGEFSTDEHTQLNNSWSHCTVCIES